MAAFSPRRIPEALYRLEDLVVCLLLGFMIVLSCLQIGLRTFFSSGISWADALLRYMVLWSGLLGAVVSTRMGKHIAIDLISHLMPPFIVRWLKAAVEIFSMGICILLTRASIVFVINEASFEGDQIILGMTSWQLNLIFPIAFGLISLHFLVCAINETREAISNKSDKL